MIAVTTFTTIPVAETAYGHIETNLEGNTYSIQSSDWETLHAYTEREVRKYFSDIPVMIQIARCESEFRHTLSDGSVLRGRVDNSDTGVMQINKRYHEKRALELDLDLEDLHDNMEYARDLYERKGTKPWSASAPCWEKTLAKA